MGKNTMGKNIQVLVIGESCKDIFHYGEATRLAPEAPAPVFVPSYRKENDGMAGNVASNLRSLGADVILMTNTNPIVKSRYIDDNTNHLLLRIDEGDNEVTPFYFTLNDIAKYDAVIISDYNKGFLSESKIEHICNLHPLVLIDTKKLLGSYCEKAAFIKINSHEYERTKQFISPKLLDKLIITCGKDGAKYMSKIYPVPKVDVKDLSGSGDTFIAAFTFKFILTKNIDESIGFANEAATKVVQRRGVCNAI
jgi:D-beta-D-heptose 7-phosphate kinase/D-beta-D-heptose 1-phosphate adenosyltransferase